LAVHRLGVFVLPTDLREMEGVTEGVQNLLRHRQQIFFAACHP
jgi:hypothetical protein